MKIVKTNKGTYEAMKIIGSTFNFVGTYEYTLDGEIINGYEYEEVDGNNEDEFTPIAKVECNDGYFYATNYKDDVENRL